LQMQVAAYVATIDDKEASGLGGISGLVWHKSHTACRTKYLDDPWSSFYFVIFSGNGLDQPLINEQDLMTTDTTTEVAEHSDEE
jgi:hypothetical protein